MSSGVEFDEDSFSYGRRPRPASAPASSSVRSAPVGAVQSSDGYYANEPKMVRWLMRHGLAKSPNSANAILVVVVLINIIITFIVIKSLL